MPNINSDIEIYRIEAKILGHIREEAESICEGYPISLVDAYNLFYEWLIDNPLSDKVDTPWIRQYLLDHDEEE